MNATDGLVLPVVEPDSDAAGAEIVLADYVLSDQVGHRLRRAHQRATAIFINGIADAQLTPTQWAALVTLHTCGPLSQNQLGRLTFMDPATTQGVIVRLAERGLVDRVPDPHDRRRTSVRLTPVGEAAVLQNLSRAHEITARTLEPLSPEEQQELLRLLSRLM